MICALLIVALRFAGFVLSWQCTPLELDFASAMHRLKTARTGNSRSKSVQANDGAAWTSRRDDPVHSSYSGIDELLSRRGYVLPYVNALFRPACNAGFA